MTKRLAIFVSLALLLAALAPLSVSAQAACGSTYTVAFGDTLARIAARCGTSVNALLQANPGIRNSNLIFAGQRLVIPTAQPQPGVQRVRFAAGDTAAVVNGTVPSRATQRYVFGAVAGQLINVDIENPTAFGNVVLIIFGADGTVLISDHAGATSFRGIVPTTQDYFIDVRSGANTPTPYTLSLIIPQRISFARGASSAVLSGALPAQGTHNYVIRASAGQTLTLDVDSPGEQTRAILIVYGADGTVLQTDHVGASTFKGTLPSTQDYLVDVRSVVNVPIRYTLGVSVPPR